LAEGRSHLKAGDVEKARVELEDPLLAKAVEEIEVFLEAQEWASPSPHAYASQ
jgi:hypothetical protein